jgi:glycosyltransferase involved in cell wall biosynthesis
VLYYGVDLTPFQTPVDGLALRQELGIPKDAFVLGHVGRFEEQKNHLFLLEIAAAVIQKEPLTRLLLIGDGSLRSVIEDKIKQMGLTPYVIFAGLRSDVPQLIQSVMDVFLLPSFHEGLPVVGMEAQAAGLPLILSDVITEELDLVKPLIKRLSLSQGASEWAKAVLESPSLKSLYPQAESLTSMENSPFNIAYSVQDITKIYDPQ